MFESNFSVDAAVGTPAVLWNAFKRVVGGTSKEQRTALSSATAIGTHRLETEK